MRDFYVETLIAGKIKKAGKQVHIVLRYSGEHTARDLPAYPIIIIRYKN